MNKGQGAIARTNKVEPAAAATVTGANNGLSLSGTTVQLGGPLVQNTAIDQAGAFNFEIDLNGGARGLFIDSVGFLFQLGDLAPLSAGTNIQIDASANDTVLFKTGGDTGTNFFEFNNGSLFYTYGDIANANNGFVSFLDDPAKLFSISGNAGAESLLILDGQNFRYRVGDIGLLNAGTQIDINDPVISIGDVTTFGNGTTFVVDEQQARFTMNSVGGTWFFIDTNSRFIIGDVNIINNGTKIDINDGFASQRVTISANNGLFLIGDTTLIHTGTTLTNNAGAAAGTLLNAPAAGNPTKWIPIDDNGTIRNIPAW